MANGVSGASRFNLRVLEGGRASRGRRHDGATDRHLIVIVVDDDEISRELLAGLVKRLHCARVDVKEFAGPDEALSFAREHEVDLGLIDLHLGEGRMSGLELVDRIRKETASGDAFSAILITADTEPMVVYEATRHNVHAVLEKAVDPYRLALRCSALLRIPPPQD